MDEKIALGVKLVKLNRVKEIEDEIHHDVNGCGPCSGRAIRGLRENGYISVLLPMIFLDRQQLLQIKDALLILPKRDYQITTDPYRSALSHKKTVCAGRTHGQIGVPTTYGLRFAIWASEIDRHIERLDQLMPQGNCRQDERGSRHAGRIREKRH